jgi:hypothetical protein
MAGAHIQRVTAFAVASVRHSIEHRVRIVAHERNRIHDAGNPLWCSCVRDGPFCAIMARPVGCADGLRRAG